MIVEERTYTVKPGAIAEYLKIYEAEGQHIQIPILGRLVGWYWSELGPLNQTVQMWAYESLTERQERRAEMMKNPKWMALARDKILPLLVNQHSKILKPAAWSPPIGKPITTGHGRKMAMVEHRCYTLHAGADAQYTKLYGDDGFKLQGAILGNLVGWYTSEFGGVNQITHMWGYESHADRDGKRAELGKNGPWQAFLPKIRALCLTQDNKLLIPAPWSPR